MSVKKPADNLGPRSPSPGQEPAAARYLPAGRPSGTQTSSTRRASGCHPGPTEGSSPAWETPGTWKYPRKRERGQGRGGA